MRAALLLMLVATLAGCSRSDELATQAPLLRPADAAGAPKLRNGLWRFIWPNSADNLCPFDATQPVSAWPGCNAAVWVAPDRMTDIAFANTFLGPTRTTRSYAYALGGGGSFVLQRYGEVYERRYSYDAIDDIERDAAGRIVAARLTPIDCVDPAAFTQAMAWQANAVTDDNTHPIDDAPADAVQLVLLPGFFRDARGDCRPHDLTALSGAATAAATASNEGVNFRWVRGGDR